MKKILVLIFIAASLNAIGQRPFTEVVRSLGKFDSLMVSGTRVTAIGVDSTTTYGSNAKLITERAAKAYARSVGGTNFYNSDGALTGNREVTGAYSLTFTDQSSFNVVKSGVGRVAISNTVTQIYAPGGNTGIILSTGAATIGASTFATVEGGSASGRTSSAVFNADSIKLMPSLGVMIIDSLATSSSPTHLLTWIETAGANRGKTQALALGTGIAAVLGVNTGSAGAPVLFNGSGGTPSSMTGTNITGIPLSTGVTGLLPIANGGTNNASLPVTAGTVYFGDGSKITGDNSNFFWDNTNKRLGIGVSSPSQKFHVQSSGTVGLFKSTGYSTSTVIIEDPDGTTYITNGQFKVNTVPFIMNANSSYISFQTGGVERARVLNSGEFGVGTSTPNSTLHVAGSLSLGYKFVEDDNYQITSTDYTLSVNNGENNWTIILPDASTCQGRIYIIKRYDNSSTGIVTIDAAASSNVQSPATGSFGTTFDLTAWGTQYQYIKFQSNGNHWEAVK